MHIKDTLAVEKSRPICQCPGKIVNKKYTHTYINTLRIVLLHTCNRALAGATKCCTIHNAHTHMQLVQSMCTAANVSPREGDCIVGTSLRQETGTAYGVSLVLWWGFHN